MSVVIKVECYAVDCFSVGWLCLLPACLHQRCCHYAAHVGQLVSIRDPPVGRGGFASLSLPPESMLAKKPKAGQQPFSTKLKIAQIPET